MGVRFGREYSDIIKDLTDAVVQIPGCHELFEMSMKEWIKLTVEEQKVLVQTLSDDIFYALGADSKLQVGDSWIIHDAVHHIIKISQDEKVVHIVYLV